MNFLSPLFVLFSALVAFIAFTTIIRKRTAKSRRKRIEKVFANRKSLDEPAFYRNYFQAKGVPMYVAIGVRQVLEEVLDVDLTRLNAEDNFTTNLHFFFERDSFADVEIVTQLEQKFGIKFSAQDAESMTTVADIVNVVWAKEKEKQRPY
jgi:acyl carrier protein